MKQEHAEANGTAAPAKPPMRKRKELEEAAQEYAEHTPERRVLDFVLGIREKIS